MTMANTVRANGKAISGRAFEAVIAAQAGLQVALPKGSRGGARAPKSFTGCVSEISSCAAHGHAYADALRDYAAVYEAYQSYLTPKDILSQHDYDSAIRSVDDGRHLGCLNDELLDFALPTDAVSDEEIESCGYLGWLHHS
jgi:hypothetical protein